MDDKVKYLRVVLVVVGLIFVLGIYPLMRVWPSGWRWTPNQHEYEQMIVLVYATLGVFLIRAAKNPIEHLSLIWFTVWSSIAHGGIMAMHVFQDPAESGHLYGDVPALFIVAIALAVFTPRAAAMERGRATAPGR